MSQMESVCKDMKQRLVQAEAKTVDMIDQANHMKEYRYALSFSIYKKCNNVNT